jgi:hypothetical protein
MYGSVVETKPKMSRLESIESVYYQRLANNQHLLVIRGLNDPATASEVIVACRRCNAFSTVKDAEAPFSPGIEDEVLKHKDCMVL